jgi:hypothetical protein
MKLPFTRSKKLSLFSILSALILLASCGSPGNKQLRMSDPMTTLLYGGALNKDQVRDLEQNFYWSYKAGGINLGSDTPRLHMRVTQDLLERIDTTRWTEGSDTGLVFYYGLSTEGGDNYFTYLVTNAYYDVSNNTINPIGLYNTTTRGYDADKYLVLTRDPMNPTLEITGKGHYLSDYYSGVHMNVMGDSAIRIDSVAEHPRSCFYNLNAFYHFYNDNRAGIEAGTAIMEVRHGALDKGLLPNGSGVSRCKVQTPVFVFRVNSDLLLGNNAFFDNPFKNHAMEFGQTCPPGSCNCN